MNTVSYSRCHNCDSKLNVGDLKPNPKGIGMVCKESNICLDHKSKKLFVDRYISNTHPNKVLFVEAGKNLLDVNFIGNDKQYFKDIRLRKSHDNLKMSDYGRIGMGRDVIETVINDINNNGYAVQ